MMVMADIADVDPNGGEPWIEAAWSECHDAALGYARHLAGLSHAEDIVAEAVVRVLGRVQATDMRIANFKAYLLTAVRNVALTRGARRREFPRDDLGSWDERAQSPVHDDLGSASYALKELPTAWRDVLWRAEVLGEPLAEIATSLGTNANSVGALSYRAREALRKAYLAGHLGSPASPECSVIHVDLPAYVRGTSTSAKGAVVRRHLAACAPCRAGHAELSAIARRMPTRGRGAAKAAA